MRTALLSPRYTHIADVDVFTARCQEITRCTALGDAVAAYGSVIQRLNSRGQPAQCGILRLNSTSADAVNRSGPANILSLLLPFVAGKNALRVGEA